MAQQALPPGAVRRRTAFGLLDADGWTWAGLKAAFWFIFIMFMLAVVPNWAYYFTTGETISVGYNFASIVNLCPADNEDLPCPAPAGAPKPWQTSPAELAMPAARSGSASYQSGSTVYLIGGAVDGTATDAVLETKVGTDGNLSGWTEGPALPEPRTLAAVGVFSGVPYVVGGLDASGQPTDTVYQGVVEQGVLTGWQPADGENRAPELTLPEPRAGAQLVNGTAGFVLLGGYDANGEPTDGVSVAWTDDRGALSPWQHLESVNLPEPRAEAVASRVGNFVFVVGGIGPDGKATDTVYSLEFDANEPATNEAGDTIGWLTAGSDEVLPAPRAGAISFNGNGAVYVIGGVDQTGSPQDSMFWVVPDATTGAFDWLGAAGADGPAGGHGPSADGRRRLARLHLRWRDTRRRDRWHVARGALSPASLLPAGHRRCDHPGSGHQGRDRAAARLHERDGRGHGELRDPDHPGHRPQPA